MISEDGGPLYIRCDSCGSYPAPGTTLMKCSSCKCARYCNQNCQKADWKRHKGPCKSGTALKADLPSQVAFNEATVAVQQLMAAGDREFMRKLHVETGKAAWEEGIEQLPYENMMAAKSRVMREEIEELDKRLRGVLRENLEGLVEEGELEVVLKGGGEGEPVLVATAGMATLVEMRKGK